MKLFINKLVREQNNNYQTLIFGKSLKGWKALGKVIKAGEYILKPFSRKYAVAVKRNARKIGKSHRKYQKIM